MRHPISEADRRKIETALRVIGEAIKAEYPEPSDFTDQDCGEPEFRWGLGDGFALALRAVVDSALPRWREGR